MEVKHVEEVGNRRHVLGNIGVAGIEYGILQIVAAAAGQWPVNIYNYLDLVPEGRHEDGLRLHDVMAPPSRSGKWSGDAPLRPKAGYQNKEHPSPIIALVAR